MINHRFFLGTPTPKPTRLTHNDSQTIVVVYEFLTKGELQRHKTLAISAMISSLVQLDYLSSLLGMEEGTSRQANMWCLNFSLPHSEEINAEALLKELGSHLQDPPMIGHPE